LPYRQYTCHFPGSNSPPPSSSPKSDPNARYAILSQFCIGSEDRFLKISFKNIGIFKVFVMLLLPVSVSSILPQPEQWAAMIPPP
jgi:hypothetical protein